MTHVRDIFFRYSRFHLVGIKGVAMTAFAQCLVDLGKEVTGSDIEEDFVTKDILDTLNIQVKNGFHESNIDTQIDCVIYTGAHHGSENPEVIYAKSKDIPTFSHAQALGLLMEGKKGISVCGVGGKTTTSAMIAWILTFAKKDPSFAIGVGNIPNLEKTGHFSEKTEYFVAEADEYMVDPGHDKTPRFLFQSPFITVCTNIAYDHPDVYASLEETRRAYKTFFEKLPSNGTLIINTKKDMTAEFWNTFKGEVYALDEVSKGETQTEHQKTHTSFSLFDASYVLTLRVPGQFNVSNALMAVIAAYKAGVSIETSLKALEEFKGTMRRFEYKGEVNGAQCYDDYAHHPTEIDATLEALKAWCPQKRTIALFQPHTYSRTRSLLKEFSQCFTKADEVYLLDIFASAREALDPTMSSDVLAEYIYQETGKKVHNLHTIQAATKFFVKHLTKDDVFITLGAGDLYHLYDHIHEP